MRCVALRLKSPSSPICVIIMEAVSNLEFDAKAHRGHEMICRGVPLVCRSIQGIGCAHICDGAIS